jgi:hypothetical protein
MRILGQPRAARVAAITFQAMVNGAEREPATQCSVSAGTCSCVPCQPSESAYHAMWHVSRGIGQNLPVVPVRAHKEPSPDVGHAVANLDKDLDSQVTLMGNP